MTARESYEQLTYDESIFFHALQAVRNVHLLERAGLDATYCARVRSRAVARLETSTLSQRQREFILRNYELLRQGEDEMLCEGL